MALDRTRWMSFAAAWMAATVVTSDLGFGQRSGDPLRVFTSAARQGAPEGEDPTVLRRKYVSANLAQNLRQSAIILDLFDDVSVLASRTYNGAKWVGDNAWIGKIAGDASSEVTLVERGGVVAGTIRMGQRVIKIRPTDDGLHALEEVDASKFSQCATSDEHKVAAAQHDVLGTGSPSSTQADVAPGTGTMDIMVAYTPEARVSAGSESAILATIDLAVLETNQAYANSGIDYRLQLVKTHEVNYAEVSSFTEMLGRLKNPNDGNMDEIHGLRDMYGADLVTLIVGGSQYCGLGYLMTNPGPGFESWAFSVVARGCATGFYSFAHELGHNLGCQHDRDHAGSGAYDWSYGHRASDSSWRTIMAYAPGSRINHFSNPNVMHQGEPTGVVNTSAQGADNAMTINATAAIVSEFRDATVYTFGEGKLTSEGVRPALSWTGRPEVQDNEFELELAGAIPRSFGILLRGSVYSPHPFHGGTLYFGSPFRRMGPVQIDLDGEATSPLDITDATPGTTDYYQIVFRDPLQLDDTGIGLSSAVKVTYLP